MKTRKKLIHLLSILLVLTLSVGLPLSFAQAADSGANYVVTVSEGVASSGEVLTVRSGNNTFTLAIGAAGSSQELKITDTRAYAGELEVSAGLTGETELLRLSDPNARAITAEGSWSSAFGGRTPNSATVTFNGKEYKFEGKDLELNSSKGTLTLHSDGTFTFAAEESTSSLSIGVDTGSSALTVGIQRSAWQWAENVNVTLTSRNSRLNEWVGINQPAGCVALEGNGMPWTTYCHFSIYQGQLFYRQASAYTTNVKKGDTVFIGTFTIPMEAGGSLVAEGSWLIGLDRYARKTVYFNDAPCMRNVTQTGNYGAMLINENGNWRYTADTTEADAYAFAAGNVWAQVSRCGLSENMPTGDTFRRESDEGNYSVSAVRTAAGGAEKPSGNINVNVNIKVDVLP